jgi:hypothetical protein
MKIKTISRNNTLLSSSASAQVSVNLNIGTEPSNICQNNEYSNIEYYYLPYWSYYDVRRQQFIF